MYIYMLEFILYCVFLVTPCIFVCALPLAGNKHVLFTQDVTYTGKESATNFMANIPIEISVRYRFGYYISSLSINIFLN